MASRIGTRLPVRDVAACEDGGVTVIADLLSDLLSTAVGLLTTPPERQLVVHGDDFAHDCEMLAVHVSSIGFGTIAPPNGGRSCIVVPSVTLVVTLLRCWPTITTDGAPTAEAITTAAVALADDGSALALGFANCDGLFPSVDQVSCDDVSFVPGLDPIAPEGGLAGWTFTLDVTL